jgi:hypothetical protein
MAHPYKGVMSDRGERPLPDDLLRVAERLREERPSLDGLALDRAKTRARARASAPESGAVNHGKGALLRSRIAITMILAVDILMSLSGAGLAVSGLGDSGDAADVQYSNPGDDSATTLGDAGDSAHPADVQPAAQESSDPDENLPFTGFAAIPVLVGGLALLSSGIVLRRRSARE